MDTHKFTFPPPSNCGHGTPTYILVFAIRDPGRLHTGVIKSPTVDEVTDTPTPSGLLKETSSEHIVSAGWFETFFPRSPGIRTSCTIHPSEVEGCDAVWKSCENKTLSDATYPDIGRPGADR